MLELTVRLVLSLAVVVGLLMLLARFGAKKFRGSSGALVNVVHRQPLSRTSAVAVVTVGTRVLVLGTTEQQVSVLAELDPDELDPDAVSHEVPAEFADVFEAAQLQAAPLELQAPAPVVPAAPAAPARPAARPASKAPAWDPNAALRTLPAVRAPRVTEAVAESTTEAPSAGSSAAVDAILAAVDAHNSRPLAPALAILDDETATKPRRLSLTPQLPVEATGRLSGSVLSAQTWKQAFAAVTSRRAS